jgi:hypothetical protein
MRILFMVTLAGALGVHAMGCTAQNEQTLVVTEALAPSVGGMSGPCGPSMTPIPRGVLDLGLVNQFGAGYVMWPSLVNNLISNASFNHGIETNQIQVSSAEVDLAFDTPPPTALADNELHFQQVILGTVDPKGTAVIPVEVIPATTARKLADAATTGTLPTQTVFVSLRVVGAANNDTIKSNKVVFGVDLCNGCLMHNIGPCCADPKLLGSCNPVQDDVLDCCDQGGSVPRCPSFKDPTLACM